MILEYDANNSVGYRNDRQYHSYEDESNEEKDNVCFNLIDQYLDCIKDRLEKFRPLGSKRTLRNAIFLKKVNYSSNMFKTLLAEDSAIESAVHAQDKVADELKSK